MDMDMRMDMWIYSFLFPPFLLIDEERETKEQTTRQHVMISRNSTLVNMS